MVQNEICRVLKAVAYLIDAWIRDGYHADTENSDDSKMLFFSYGGNLSCN